MQISETLLRWLVEHCEELHNDSGRHSVSLAKFVPNEVFSEWNAVKLELERRQAIKQSKRTRTKVWGGTVDGLYNHRFSTRYGQARAIVRARSKRAVARVLAEHGFQVPYSRVKSRWCESMNEDELFVTIDKENVLFITNSVTGSRFSAMQYGG